MAFKKPYDEESLKKKNVKVKNSYYTFSKEYPIGNLTKRKTSGKKENRVLFRRIAFYAVCFVLLSTLSYFIFETGLKFSSKEPSTSTSSQQVAGEAESASQTNEALSVRAFFLSEDKLSDTKHIKHLISQIKRHDADSVVISFKARDGHLSYQSKSKNGAGLEAVVYDNETVRKSLSLFKSKNIKIIAQIYCFEDPLVSEKRPELAVKYMNTDVTWLDAAEDRGGKSWLNPYSKKAKKYLLDVVSEVCDFGVSGFILKGVSFPTEGSLEAAGFPGEKSKSERDEVLQSFVKSVREKLSDEQFVIVSQSAGDTSDENGKYLFGSLTKSEADGFCADLSSRPDEYVIDRKSHYSSILSYVSRLENSVGEKDKLIVEISSGEATYGFLRALSKNGYNSFVIY